MVHEHVRKAIRARNDWLEDVLAGLLINGVKVEEISVRDTFGPKTEVWVRGKCKYKWTLKLEGVDEA